MLFEVAKLQLRTSPGKTKPKVVSPKPQTQNYFFGPTLTISCTLPYLCDIMTVAIENSPAYAELEDTAVKITQGFPTWPMNGPR